MHIQSINNYHNQPSYKAGLYFVKKNVIFDRTLKEVCFDPKAIVGETVKTSKDGFHYIEDNLISQDVKGRFANVPFIRDLAEKFDTFICFCELPIGHKNNPSGFENYAFTIISWGDESVSRGVQLINKVRNKFGKEPLPIYAKTREVLGGSEKSQQSATDKMFKNLEDERFC